MTKKLKSLKRSLEYWRATAKFRKVEITFLNRKVRNLKNKLKEGKYKNGKQRKNKI